MTSADTALEMYLGWIERQFKNPRLIRNPIYMDEVGRLRRKWERLSGRGL